jgi:hypothetical protein
MAACGSASHHDGTLLARLQRIDALDRRGASPAELLPELRRLLEDAERRPRAGADGGEVVERLRAAQHRT